MYRYYFLNRPPIEAYPLVPGNPAYGMLGSDVLKEYEDPVWHNRVFAYGFVEYSKPLDLSTVWKYEISPADKIEWAKFRFYLMADRDILAMEAMIEDYVTHFDILKTNDPLYEPAQILKESQEKK